MSDKYLMLRKVYYSNKKEYENEYNRRINSESVKKYDLLINGYPLFVLYTPEILNLISSIYEKRTLLNDVILETPKNALNQYELLILCDELKASNEIEGINTTRKDLEKTLEYIHSKKQISSKRTNEKRIFGLLNKYVKLVNDENIELKNSKDVRDLYFELLEEEIKYSDSNNLPDGKIFRKDKVYVMKGGTSVVHEGVYPEVKIIEYMDKALELLNSEEVPLVNIALFHYLFGYIHPFYDGNGRLNRFISSAALSKALNLPLAGIKLSQVINDNKKSYYKSFEETNDELNRGDATTFVIKFLKTIDKEIDDLIEAINDKRDLFNYHLNKLNENDDLSKKSSTVKTVTTILEYTLFSIKGASVEDLTKQTGLNYKTVMNVIKDLDNKKMLIKNKDGKTYYLLDYKKL